MIKDYCKSKKSDKTSHKAENKLLTNGASRLRDQKINIWISIIRGQKAGMLIHKIMVFEIRLIKMCKPTTLKIQNMSQNKPTQNQNNPK